MPGAGLKGLVWDGSTGHARPLEHLPLSPTSASTSLVEATEVIQEGAWPWAGILPLLAAFAPGPTPAPPRFCSDTWISYVCVYALGALAGYDLGLENKKLFKRCIL